MTKAANPSMTDDQIIEAAMKIQLRRLKREGSITDPMIAGDYMSSRLAHLEHEEFHVMLLDTRHRIIECKMLFRGTIDGCEVHPREVIKYALSKGAAAIIAAHNHPSGDASPSASDRAVTNRLRDAAQLMDIRLLDHLIVGEHVISLASRGWL